MRADRAQRDEDLGMRHTGRGLTWPTLAIAPLAGTPALPALAGAGAPPPPRPRRVPAACPFSRPELLAWRNGAARFRIVR